MYRTERGRNSVGNNSRQLRGLDNLKWILSGRCSFSDVVVCIRWKRSTRKIHHRRYIRASINACLFHLYAIYTQSQMQAHWILNVSPIINRNAISNSINCRWSAVRNISLRLIIHVAGLARSIRKTQPRAVSLANYTDRADRLFHFGN